MGQHSILIFNQCRAEASDLVSSLKLFTKNHISLPPQLITK
jgi:hypothetical protein